MERVLVVGARKNSLGDAVCYAAEAAGYDVVTAGISGEEIKMDAFVDGPIFLSNAVARAKPQHLVCTIGFNMSRHEHKDYDLHDWYRWHFEANVIGPMRLLEAFKLNTYGARGLRHFVGISSNSARIPRTASAAYCASKAAFSMALRVAAREALGGDNGYLVYGYEPGLLRGTPMTNRAAEAFSGPLTRMRGKALEKGIEPRDLANVIVSGLKLPGAALNGCLIPYDGDEL